MRLHGDDLATSVRALRLLLATRRPRLSSRDRDTGRDRLVTWAGSKRSWFVCAWVYRAVREQLWTPEWRNQLVQLAEEDGGSQQLGARRILDITPRAR